MGAYNNNIGIINGTDYSKHIHKYEPIYSLSNLNISTAQSVNCITRTVYYNPYRTTDTTTNLNTVEINNFFSTNTNVSQYMTFSSGNPGISSYKYTFSIPLPSFMSNLSTACIITGAKISFDAKTNKSSGSNYVQVQIGSQGQVDAHYFNSSYQDYSDGGDRTIIMPYSNWTHYTHITSSNYIPITNQGVIDLPIWFFLVEGSIDIYINNLRIEEIYYIPRFHLNLHRINNNNITQYIGFLQDTSSVITAHYDFYIRYFVDEYEQITNSIDYIYDSNEMASIFVNNNYTYNNVSYSYSYENWSALQNGSKDNSYNSNSSNAYYYTSQVPKRTLMLANLSDTMINVYCDVDVDLYLVEPTILNYTITYNYNSGNYTNTYADTGAPNSTYTILLNNILYNNATGLDASKNIAGWATASDSNTITYTSGQSFTLTQNTILYAVWEDRISVTFQENGTTLTSSEGTYGYITNSSCDGVYQGNYYYNVGSIIQNCSYTLNKLGTSSAPQGRQVYIKEIQITASDGVTTNLINGTKSSDCRQWNSTNQTANNNQNIIINFILAKNLAFRFNLYIKNTPVVVQPSSINDDFTLEILSADSDLYYTLEALASGDYPFYQYTYYLNPGDSIEYKTTYNNLEEKFYISKFIIPDPNNVRAVSWSPSSSTLFNGLIEISRNTARNNSGTTYPQILSHEVYNDEQFKYDTIEQVKGLYKFTATLNHMSSDMNNFFNLSCGILYEPFNCWYRIYHNNYTTTGGDSNTYDAGSHYLAIENPNNNSFELKFFNDIIVNPNYYRANYRVNNNTKHVIINITSEDSDLNFNNFLTSSLQDNLIPNSNYKGFSLYPFAQNILNYKLNQFIGWKVHPTEYMIQNYHSPYVINITWGDADYKCFIILKLPEVNNNEASISTVLSSDTSGWITVSDIALNRKIYTKEIFDINSITSINASFRDIANSGYILKEIRKCSYNGNYNATLSDTTITREQLDAMTSANAINTLSAINITRNSPDTNTGSNDKLTFSKSNLNNNPGVVDYYFITYEEGLPIFYPGDENDPKRAIQLFWENTRAIGLYYENTRLL